jgi:hypothetical protein
MKIMHRTLAHTPSDTGTSLWPKLFSATPFALPSVAPAAGWCRHAPTTSPPRPMYRLARSDGRYFLRTMCIGVDQRISLIIGNM